MTLFLGLNSFPGTKCIFLTSHPWITCIDKYLTFSSFFLQQQKVDLPIFTGIGSTLGTYFCFSFTCFFLYHPFLFLFLFYDTALSKMKKSLCSNRRCFSTEDLKLRTKLTEFSPALCRVYRDVLTTCQTSTMELFAKIIND